MMPICSMPSGTSSFGRCQQTPNVLVGSAGRGLPVLVIGRGWTCQPYFSFYCPCCGRLAAVAGQPARQSRCSCLLACVPPAYHCTPPIPCNAKCNWMPLVGGRVGGRGRREHWIEKGINGCKIGKARGLGQRCVDFSLCLADRRKHYWTD